MTATINGVPRILVFSSLFPSSGRPNAGLFIRERLFHVGRILPIVVVSPVPWFPFQSMLRVLRPNYRPTIPKYEKQSGVDVHFPRFFSLPGIGRALDGFSMALCCWWLIKKIKADSGIDIIDAHFAYPDGYAATLLARWFKVPVTITLRGTEVPLSKTNRRGKILSALSRATRVFAVADALKRHVVNMGAEGDKIVVIGNGIDIEKFYPMNKIAAREKYGLPADAKVLVTVGGLVERKGFHRVIECIPALLKKTPSLHYLVVGGASPEGDMSAELRRQVNALFLNDRVHFLGALTPEVLRIPLSAGDVFVLSTRNEGWANVFLEAMACGLPVVTTAVGGNAEVVNSPELGTLVPFGDRLALEAALTNALLRDWNREAIRSYAAENSWDARVDILVAEFHSLFVAHQVEN